MIEIADLTKKRTKILWISDSCIAPSGVGVQTRYVIDGLSKTGKYEFVHLAGAIRHHSYEPWKYNEVTKVYNVDGYGTKEIIRSLIRTEKPDQLVFFTDPRFFYWLFEIESEIRPFIPMIFNTIWDSGPPPGFNAKYYRSCDELFCISKLTHQLVQTVVPDVSSHYVPHAIDLDVFKRYPEQEIAAFRKQVFPKEDPKNPRFVFFFNSRNARRKGTGSMLWWYADFLEKVGKDKACLIMHTDPKDPNGQDLIALMEARGLVNGEVVISNQKIDPKGIAMFNNISDCGINLSDAEGHGCAAFESLACEVPFIAPAIGGLTDQIIDRDTGEVYGVAMEPAVRSIIGSQDVHYIEENRCDRETFMKALETMFNMPKEQRQTIGKKSREYIKKYYNLSDCVETWDNLLTKIAEEKGSWFTRKQYKSWTMEQL